MAQTEQAMDVHCHKEGEGEHWKRKSELERALQQRGRGGVPGRDREALAQKKSEMSAG